MLKLGRRGLAVALIACAGSLSIGASAQARGTLDQDIAPGSTAPLGLSTGQFGQTFTARLSGSLDTVALPLTNNDGTVAYTATLYQAGPDERPVGNPLASQAVSIAPGTARREFTFDQPGQVVAGTHYVVLFTGPRSGFTGLASTSNSYAYGRFTYNNPAYDQYFPTIDLQFQTYVTASQSFSLNANGRAVGTSSYGKPASSGGDLTTGQSYDVSIGGTFSIWSKDDWSLKANKTCGTPESSASGPVGLDAASGFAILVRKYKNCRPASHYGLLQLSTDGGNTWTEPTLTAGSRSHSYTTTVTGVGKPLMARIRDNTPQDNYGSLDLTVGPTAAPTTPTN